MNWTNIIGNKGKKVAQDVEGRLEISPQKGESEIIIFSKTNPLPPRSAGDYELRDTARKAHSFPHLWTPYLQPPNTQKEYRNIFDQSFVISSTLDADITVHFIVIELSSNAEVLVDLMKIDLGTLYKPSDTTPSLMILTPERTTKNVTGATVQELPELRQPYPAFKINIEALTAPTTGEIKILNTRRY